MCLLSCAFFFFFFKQKTAYELRISDWSSDVCSSDLIVGHTTTDHARIFLRGDHANNRAFAGIRHRRQGDTRWSKGHFVQLEAYRDMSDVIVLRSEERRVGEECVSTVRSRWWRNNKTKKIKKDRHRQINNKNKH